MNIKELAAKYYLHDSSVEKINFDEKNKNLTLTIEFCFWMQNWYKNDEPTNGKISVIFENVSLFEYDENISDRIFSNELDSEIYSAEIDDDGNFVIFSVETIYDSDCDDIYWQLKIKSENVKVTELERYNL